jgi:hypothetical protein
MNFGLTGLNELTGLQPFDRNFEFVKLDKFKIKKITLDRILCSNFCWLHKKVKLYYSFASFH